MKKIRTVFYMDEGQRKIVEELSAKSGASQAEILRRAVVIGLKKLTGGKP
jgi:hypothetical protein